MQLEIEKRVLESMKVEQALGYINEPRAIKDQKHKVRQLEIDILDDYNAFIDEAY